MKAEIKIKDQRHRVEISEIEENILKVAIDDENYYFSQNNLGELIMVSPDSFKKNQEKGEVIGSGLLEKEIRSPIAGIISAIEVKKGDQVRPGQRVATLIAMKMENEIIAETFGMVKDIKVKEKQFVNSNEVLISLK